MNRTTTLLIMLVLIGFLLIQCSETSAVPPIPPTIQVQNIEDLDRYDLKVKDSSKVPVYENFYDSSRDITYPHIDPQGISIENVGDGDFVSEQWNVYIYLSNSQTNYNTANTVVVSSGTLENGILAGKSLSPFSMAIPIQQNSLRNSSTDIYYAWVVIDDGYSADDEDPSNDTMMVGSFTADDSGDKRVYITTNSDLEKNTDVDMFLFTDDILSSTEKTAAANKTMTESLDYADFSTQTELQDCCFLSWWESQNALFQYSTPTYFPSIAILGADNVEADGINESFYKDFDWAGNSCFIWDKYLELTHTYYLRVQLSPFNYEEIPDTGPYPYSIAMFNYSETMDLPEGYIPVIDGETGLEVDMSPYTGDLVDSSSAYVWDYTKEPQLNTQLIDKTDVHWYQITIKN